MARTKKPKPAIEPVNYFHCEACKCELQPNELAAHLKDIHGIENTKGKREMLMHLDAADSYCSTYKWTVGEIQLMQYTRNPRSPEDQMYWQH